MTSARSCDT